MAVSTYCISSHIGNEGQRWGWVGGWGDGMGSSSVRLCVCLCVWVVLGDIIDGHTKIGHKADS